MRKRCIIASGMVIALVASLTVGCGKKDSKSNPTTTQEETTIEETSTQEETSNEETSKENDNDEDGNVSLKKTVEIDGNTALTAEGTLYDGLGFISANNSSRLLLDYKSENPEAYWEILNYVFGEQGIGMNLIKVEMGADIDSSSGTEPGIMRTEDEKPDVTRGASYQLIADALKINPDIEVDMLYWGMPKWVADAENEDEALYKWYKATIDALYDTYGVKTTYVTLTQNEKSYSPDSIKYLSKALKADYPEIKVVAGEGVCNWNIADDMLEDKELMDAIDVISSHYTSWTDDSAKKVQSEYGKKVWFSEGSSPMKVATLTSKKEDEGNGLSGLNGMLDIATRITQAVAEGMTMYEFQPAVSSYYTGATYFPKQLITANEPWSGAYNFDAGFYMALHFGQFFKPNWNIIKTACFGDGVPGGDGHAIEGSTYNYMTMTDSKTGDYSVMVVNNTKDAIKYTFKVKNIEKSDASLTVYETMENDGENYYESFFKKAESVTPQKDGDAYYFDIEVKPYSMITMSTLEIADTQYKDRADDYSLLELPYSDDFEYKEYDEGYLANRGYTPRYTTDQAGAFEVVNKDGDNVLMQKMNFNIKGKDWGSSSDPVTTFGDDRWRNYSISSDVHFADSEDEAKKVNYLGIGARYILATQDYSGYWLKLSSDGTFSLMKKSKEIETVTVAGLDLKVWHNLKLEVQDDYLVGYLDGEKYFDIVDELPVINSGRAALYSYYQNNYFNNLKIEKLGDSYTVTRVDDMDPSITYSEGTNNADAKTGLWIFNTISSFSNFNRTNSKGTEGCTLEFETEDTGFALIGSSKEAKIKVEVDGAVVNDAYSCSNGGDRMSLYNYNELDGKKCKVKVTVLSGELTVDAIEKY